MVLAPDGVDGVRLGMTLADLRRADVARALRGSRHDGWPPGCWVLYYRTPILGRTPGNTLNGTLSPELGVEMIAATGRMVTPEGIRIGSTLDEVRKAYDRPRATRGDLVVVRASRTATYRIQLGEVVTSISLEQRETTCHV